MTIIRAHQVTLSWSSRTVAVCDPWSNLDTVPRNHCFIHEVAQVHTCLLFDIQVSLALQIFSPIQDLSLRGGRCAVFGCSGIFRFVQLQNSIPTVPGDPFAFKMLWPVAISGLCDCRISQSEGKCVKLKECRRGYR